MLTVTGWVLTADGQWPAKLIGAALAAQAWVAWTLRKEPHLGVAKAFAFYQLASATIDWVMWLTLADQTIFSTTLSNVLTAASIPLHYSIGGLLLLAIRRQRASHPRPYRRSSLVVIETPGGRRGKHGMEPAPYQPVITWPLLYRGAPWLH